jgi:hypothetical protein
MMLTWKTRSTGREPCPGANLSTTDTGWTDLGSNPYLRGEWPAAFSFSITTCREARAFPDFPSNISLIPHLLLFRSFGETLLNELRNKEKDVTTSYMYVTTSYM